MNVGFFFPCLFVKVSVEETKDETPCGANPCELVSLSNRDNSQKPGKHVPCGSMFIMCCVIHYFIELIELCQFPVAVLVHYQSFILINYFNNWELWMKVIVLVWRMFAFRKQCSPTYTQSWVCSSNISNTRKSVSSDIQTLSGLKNEAQAEFFSNGFLVSKETVVLRLWERSKQKFGFIRRVELPPWGIWKADVSSVSPSLWRFEC